MKIERASNLVNWGSYQYTRNPMYVALALLLLAWTVWLASPVLLLGPTFFAVFIDRFQIAPEERFLQQKFGADYAAYRKKVRCWI